MKAHVSTLEQRILRAASRVRLRYRVVAVGFDHRGRIIGLATNRPRLLHRGWHAEETLIYRSPRSLCRVLIARLNNRGEFLPIDPCEVCSRLAQKRGVRIEPWA